MVTRRSSTADRTIRVVVSADPGPNALRQWDELVARVPGSDVTQLSGWSSVRRRAGYAPLYLFAWRGDELLGGAQVLLRSVPLFGRIGYVSYGPLVGPEAPRSACVRAIAQEMRRLAGGSLAALFLQPTDGHDDVTVELLALGFRASTAGVAPAATVRIDLSQEESALRAGLTKRIRRWTGKWERSGVTVRRGGPADVSVLTDLIGRSAAHQGFTELSPDYVRAMHRELSAGDHVEIFVGEVDGVPVAAELLTVCGGVLRCRFTGLDRSSPAIRLSVTSALDWEAMRWAKAHGLREFDLGGLSASAVGILLAEGFSSPNLDGPDRFKVAFGGRLHRYPGAVELISSPVLRFGYDKLGSGRRGRVLVNRARNWMRRGRGPGAGR